jgi:hypothetical protein
VRLLRRLLLLLLLLKGVKEPGCSPGGHEAPQ